MSTIIGNNVSALINEAVSGAVDPATRRKDIMAELEEKIPRNRLTGLLKGNRKINAEEIFIFSEVLGCTAEDVVILKRSKALEYAFD